MLDLAWDRYACVYIEVSNDVFGFGEGYYWRKRFCEVNTYTCVESSYSISTNSQKSIENASEISLSITEHRQHRRIDNINLDLFDAEGSRRSLSTVIGPCSVE